MKKLFLIFSFLFLFPVLTGTSVVFAQRAQYEAQVRDLEKQLVEKNKKLNDKQREFDFLENTSLKNAKGNKIKIEEKQNIAQEKKVECSKSTTTAISACDTIDQEITDLETQIKTADTEITQLTTQKETLITAIKTLTEEIKDKKLELEKLRAFSIPFGLNEALDNLNGVENGVRVGVPDHLPGISEQALQGNASDITVFIQRLTAVITILASAVAVAFIVYNAFHMVTSFGSTDVISKAKKGLLWSIAGLLIIVTSYVIVKTIIMVPYSGQNLEKPACSDGRDNDGDGKIDKEDLEGCWVTNGDFSGYDPNKNSEVGDLKPACSDGNDNDGDGLIDEQDKDCWDNPYDYMSYNANYTSEDERWFNNAKKKLETEN